MLATLPDRVSAHAAADAALRSAILGGELVPGERLPPERELATTLGISRLTLRAALATLVADGLLAVRHGSGYVVKDFQEGGPALLPNLVEVAAKSRGLPDIARDLLLVRRHLAAAVLEALVERPPARKAVARVAAAVDAFEAAVTGGADDAALGVADLAVVSALLEATGSPVLRLCLNPIAAVVSRDAALRRAIYVEPATNVVGYRLLVAWLANPRRAQIHELVNVLASRDAATVERLRRRRRP